jgi:Flp pilus assembly protein protease CpaA
MLLLILPSLIWMSASDLRSHRIPNRALIVLTCISLCGTLINGHDWSSHVTAFLVIFVVATCGWKFFGLGMGDVKLLGVLSLFLIPVNLSSYQIFTLAFAFAAIIHVAISSKGRFTCDQAIPLAPSLSLATVLVHLF